MRFALCLFAHLERLTRYARRWQVVPQFQSADAFGKFSAAIAKVVAVQTEMAVVDIVSMYSSLVTFALQARGAPSSVCHHCVVWRLTSRSADAP